MFNFGKSLAKIPKVTLTINHIKLYFRHNELHLEQIFLFYCQAIAKKAYDYKAKKVGNQYLDVNKYRSF